MRDILSKVGQYIAVELMFFADILSRGYPAKRALYAMRKYSG